MVWQTVQHWRQGRDLFVSQSMISSSTRSSEAPHENRPGIQDDNNGERLGEYFWPIEGLDWTKKSLDTDD